MTAYWVNFAATGDPNGKGLPTWTAYNAKNERRQAMVFGDTAKSGPPIDAPRLAFFDKFYAVEQGH